MLRSLQINDSLERFYLVHNSINNYRRKWIIFLFICDNTISQIVRIQIIKRMNTSSDRVNSLKNSVQILLRMTYDSEKYLKENSTNCSRWNKNLFVINKVKCFEIKSAVGDQSIIQWWKREAKYIDFFVLCIIIWFKRLLLFSKL